MDLLPERLRKEAQVFDRSFLLGSAFNFIIVVFCKL